MWGSVAASGQFGSRLADEDLERYARIVQALGESKPMARIAREQKVNPATVAVIMSGNAIWWTRCSSLRAA